MKRKPSIYTYTMNGENIPRADNHNCNHFGITMNTNCKLSWKPHISKVLPKASQTLGLIKRTLLAAVPRVKKLTYEADNLTKCQHHHKILVNISISAVPKHMHSM